MCGTLQLRVGANDAQLPAGSGWWHPFTNDESAATALMLPMLSASVSVSACCRLSLSPCHRKQSAHGFKTKTKNHTLVRRRRVPASAFWCLFD